MLICGIDPGLKGGIAFIDEDTPVMVAALPVINRKADVLQLATLLDTMNPRKVFIERQTILSKQGGALTIATNYGRLLATLELARLRYKEVSPSEWKKKAGFRPKLKGKEKQEAAYEIARREFGDRTLQRLKLEVKDDGPVEAMLLAHFGG
jgi:hypothetical protein